MASDKLQCNDCGYKFTLKGSKEVPNICPYCGREGSVNKQDSAADLLKKYGDDN